MSNNIQWPQLGGGGAVDSVNGQTGTVVLNKSDIGLGNVDNKSLTAQNLAEKDPTGFPNRTDSAISFSDASRTLTISATGASFDVWVKGTQFTISSGTPLTKSIPPITGLWWFYINNLGSLEVQNSFTPALFTDNAIVAVVYWNQATGTHTYFGEERHGLMDVDTHSYLHTVFGARYISGLALQGFVPDGTGGFDPNAQLNSDIGQIRDEDILHSLNGQYQFPVLYRVGDNWYKKTADNFPVIYNGTAGYTGTTIAYNQYVAPNWQLTPVTSGNFVCIHFFATNDVDAGVVAILGTTQYANAPQARAGAETEINSISGLPFAEFTAIGTVIFQTNSAYTNTPKARVVSSNPSVGEVYIDFRGEQLYTPSGVASSHSLLSNLGADDHLQYLNNTRGDARYVQLSSFASASTDGQLSSTNWNTFNNKQPAITGGASTITSTDLSPTKVLVSDASGKVGASAVTSTTLGFLDATSSVQTQLNNKVNKTGDTITGALIVSGSVPSGQAMMRVTNTGAGDSFVVEDSANPDTSPFKIDSSGVVIIGSALSTLSGQSRMILGDSGTCQIDLYSAVNSLSINAGPTESRISVTTGPLGLYTTDTNQAIQIYPSAGDGLGPSFYSKSDGANLRTGINNVTPTEALDVIGNIKATGTIIGSNIPFIPPVYGSEASARAVYGASLLSNTGNMTSATTGTNALALYDNTTAIGRIPHVTYTTTSTSGSTTGHRTTASFYALGSGSRFQTVFQVADASLVANARHFCGINTVSTATGLNGSTNNTPLMNSLVNFVGFASDRGAGDTNFCIYHNAGTAGGTTRIDLGASFPNTNTGEIYHVTFYNPQGSLNVMYEVKGLVSGAVARGTITTNVPTTAQLYFHCERFNAGSASVVRMEGGSLLTWTY